MVLTPLASPEIYIIISKHMQAHNILFSTADNNTNGSALALTLEHIGNGSLFFLKNTIRSFMYSFLNLCINFSYTHAHLTLYI